MKVKVKRGAHAGAYRDLSSDRVYAVLGIEADDFRLMNDDGKPFLFPAQMFDVVDPTESGDWVVTYGSDGEKYAYPPALSRVGFFEDYFDGLPAAIAAFNTAIPRT